MQLLCFEGRVEEAFEAFKLRELKGPMYRQKEMKLHLDIGWIYFAEKIEFQAAVEEFKTCVMGPGGNATTPQFFLDPREIVLMFKDLHEGSFAMAAHIKFPPGDTFK